MKSIICTRYGGPEVLQLKEIEKPVPKANEILIKIFSTTVAAEDCAFRRGKPFAARLFVTGGIFKPIKNILGTEFSGEVEAVGEKVSRFKKGDHVFGDTGVLLGTYVEYICLAEDSAISHKPNNITFNESVCGGFLTALPFLRDHGKIQKGHKVLIYGASGAIGTYAVQIAKYYGAEVTAVCSTGNVEMVKSLGADNVIDYTKKDFAQAEQEYDIIFDSVGKSSFAHCKKSLKQTGIYLRTVPTLKIFLDMFWTSKVGTKKAKIAFCGLREACEKTKDIVFLKNLIENGKIKPVIDKIYTLEEIVEAHSYVEKGHKKGNVVIMVNQ